MNALLEQIKENRESILIDNTRDDPRWQSSTDDLAHSVVIVPMFGRFALVGLLVLANHPTLIDVVFLIGHVPDALCVVKSTLANHPSTRGPVLATGYICNNSGADLLQACVDKLRAGGNLIIFPEGTRVPHGTRPDLQSGFAGLYKLLALPVVPVAVNSGPLYHRRWKRPGTVTLRVGETIPPGLPREEIEARVQCAINALNP